MEMERGTKIKTVKTVKAVKTARAFTLLEFIIVITVMGILASAIALMWPGRIINVAAQATLLADDIRYAQSLSMTQGQRYRLVQISATSYQITDSSGAIATLPLHDNPVALGQGISFTSAINTLVAFDTRGVPYSDTSIPGTALTNPLSFILSSNNQSKSVTVSPETGRVVVQ